MMQNVAQEENEETNKEIRTVEIEQSSQTGPFPSEKSPAPPTSQSTFGPDISASEDDEVSDVGSFIMDHEIDEDEQDLEPSKFLLPTEGMEASNLPSIDPETHARLEALLEAAGIGKLSTADGKALTDPEVLRKLTSSVSCALDEAAQALHRMRAEQQGQLTSAEGSRSLAEACSDGDVPTVRKLLHEGGSVHETTEEGESLLSLACSAGYYELAQVLLAMKANVEDRGIKGDCTPLMEAASGGYVDIVKLLIAHGADVNAQSSAGNTPLHYAACGGYEDVVQVLIEAGANVEQHNENGHTPLMESASAGHVGVAMILLNSGAGINTHSNEFKESALTLACYKGHLEMVKFLLEAGADQEHKTDEMHTALMEASMDGHVEVARLLLDSGAQVNMPADSFESPLTLAACGGHVELASLLIERGANLEEVNDEGYTPLMEAAREGHEEMVALLLAHEADINAQTEETQETSLTLACCGGFLEVADFLIKAGADIELGCSTPLMEAAQEGHLELVKYLLKSGANVCAQTGTGDTALTYACENGHTDVAEVLLEAGAELEHESEGGRTPLMKAARAGHLCTVQFLISKGAEVNRQTSTNDHTVLSLACAGGHLAVVELMLAHGADPAHKMKDGSTMIIEAAKGGHTQVVKLLLEYPNRVIMNSPDLAQLTDPHLTEARVPVHGLGNIVPPSDPDSTPLSSNGFINIQAGKKMLEKDITIPNRPADQVWKNMQKSVGKRNHSGGNETSGKSAKSSESAVPGEQPPPSPQLPEHSALPDLVPDETIDVKASERLEAIINNVMAKELDNTSTREEQILRKQQILQELQKVEKELQLKAQAQLILSAQHQLEQQQQQQQHIQALQRKLKKQDGVQPPSSPSLEDVSLESAVDAQPSNDLDKQVSALLASDGSSAVGQIVFPNIPYEGAIVTSSQQTGTDVGSENSKENWARNNGNVPKRSSGNNKGTRSNKNTVAATSTSTSTTVATPNKNTVTSTNTTTSTSVAPNTGIVNGTPNIEHNGVSQSQQQQQQQAVMGNNAALVAYRQQIQNMAIRQQLAPQPLQLSQQTASAQTIQFPQLQLTPEQQEQLLQMLSQQTFQQQLPQQTLPGQQLPQQHITQQPFVQPLLQQQTLQLIPPQQQQAIQQCAPGQAQYFSQQQQQQFIQQQQQAQLLLQQQQMKQPQQNIVTPNVANVQKNPRKQRHLHNNQQPLQPGVIPTNTSMLGIETITPPPSTPLTPNPSPASPQSISPLCAPIDLDAQTESNHDTALTLACHGGHSELVNLLLSKGADIEHRDKKGFTPLILAATAGHVDVVELLLDHAADMEAQSERTKDTPLSLACSGGRYEVVELLLSRGANKEHRNVSDYTPLSLAASGGYVNIIKLLLSHGAEINSRTGSKLGISPLMLAAMNGHTAAVKLLLDMGSDINAQIETNRNTALTLACFQGRHEVVSLLVDRKANIEHRAKTGLTPLMEAASGGYVEVGRVLLDKGADVNAPPVPSSRDTALTIAADKGHYRFVELLLTRGAAVDVKNKKGNSPLWLACNGGHLDVVQLLVSAGADIDSQDNRKVSCLMAAFRKGHIKVVKWMVKNVNQFPSDQELSRYIATITDKELQKKCQQCMEVIVSAKDRQAAEANKNATILLEELDKERQHEENKKAAAAKKREKKKQKKREKQEKEKETTGKSSSPEPECDSIEGNQGSDKNSVVEEDFVNTEPPSATIISTIGITLPTTTESRYSKMSWSKVNNRVDTIVVSSTESKKNKRNKREKERVPDQENMPVPAFSPSSVLSTGTTTTSGNSSSVTRLSEHSNNNNNYNKPSHHNSANTRRRKGNNNALKPTTGIGDLDDFGTLPENLKISDKEVEKLRKNVEKKRVNVEHDGKISNTEKLDVVPSSNLNVKTSPVISSPKKGQKKEEGWKEVIRKSKKVQVPSTAISRVIGRGGCNINAIREVSGAHIEVEKQRGTGGERVITIKGSADATRQAHALITALVTDPDKDLLEILPKTKAKVSTKDTMIILGPEAAIPPIGSPVTTGTTPLKSSNTNRSSRNISSQRDQNLASTGTVQSTVIWGTTPPPQSVLTSPRRNLSKTTPSGGPGSEKVVTRQLFPGDNKKSGFTIPPQTSTNTTMSYSLASTSAKVSTTSASAYVNKQDNRISNATSKSQQPPQQTRQHQQPHVQPPVGSIKVLQRPSQSQKFDQPQPLPIISNQQTSTVNGPVSSVNGGQPGMVPGMPNQGMFQPFSNMFNINVTDQLMRKDDQAERMNFASVAAAGVVSSIANPGSPTAELALSMQNLKVDPALQAKAPGFRPVNTKNMSPPGIDTEDYKSPGYKVLQTQMMNDIDASRAPGYRGGMTNHSPAVSPRSNASTASGMSPRGQNSGLDSSQHSTSSISSQKEEYTTPTQPMTLPKIQSTLNPNAPDFTSRQMGQVNLGGGNPGLTPNTLPFYLQTLYQQALAQQLLQQPGLGLSGSGMVPPGIISQQDFANLINQFVASGQNQPASGPTGGGSANQNAPTFNGLPNVPPRPFSPLQGRPSSAPNMGGGMVKDGSSPGPIGPPNAPSPMSATPPLPEQLKGDDKKQLRPIGGERAQRRAPGAPLGGIGGNLADYGPAIWSLASELSMQWNTGSTGSLNSVPMSTSTMTSTVTTGGRMSPGIVSDSTVNAVHHNNNEYIDTDEQPVNKSMQNASVGMPFFAKGMVGGGFPQQPQQQQPFIPGPVGDGMSNLWNPQAKGQVSDPTDKAMWNSWSSQTSM